MALFITPVCCGPLGGLSDPGLCVFDAFSVGKIEYQPESIVMSSS